MLRIDHPVMDWIAFRAEDATEDYQSLVRTASEASGNWEECIKALGEKFTPQRSVCMTNAYKNMRECLFQDLENLSKDDRLMEQVLSVSRNGWPTTYPKYLGEQSELSVAEQRSIREVIFSNGMAYAALVEQYDNPSVPHPELGLGTATSNGAEASGSRSLPPVPSEQLLQYHRHPSFADATRQPTRPTHNHTLESLQSPTTMTGIALSLPSPPRAR
ncbi:hypothetical protein IAR55_001401 [Kwoniella newhampshirensis]|uniref:Uncharacterized protein n=1 Tax=Kwoniella newhampshirensis TaxID=1651941 RepID=A0AAW0Z212_9TREE